MHLWKVMEQVRQGVLTPEGEYVKAPNVGNNRITVLGAREDLVALEFIIKVDTLNVLAKISNKKKG